MFHLMIFLLVSAPASGSSVTVVTFDSWEACAAAAKVISRVEITPLAKALGKAEQDKVKPDVVAVCASRHNAQAKGWD